MTIRFNKEDALTCCSCYVNKPLFRLISLERIPTRDRTLIPTCMATLLCGGCLKAELDDFHRSFAQSEIPFGEGETEENGVFQHLSALRRAP